MKIEVVNINLKENIYWRNKFEEYRENVILKNTKDDKIKNYTKKNFNIDFQLGTFLMLDVSNTNHKIAGFTSVFKPKIWSNEICRICNRTWIDPIYRSNSLSGKDKAGKSTRKGQKWGISYAYKDQIDCALKFQKKLIIISRENKPFRVNTLRSMSIGLKHLYPEWQYDNDNYYQVQENESKYTSWQKIVWKELEPEAKKYLNTIPKISVNDWKKRFEN